MDNPASTQHLVDHLFRHESGKMIAVLTRIFGMHNLEMVEDVVQESFLKAVQVWPLNQLPDNPSAWLMQTAKNKAIDIIRRQQHFQRYSKEVSQQLEQDTEHTVQQFFHDSEIADSQLQLIFACCHPSLKEEDQLALTLKTVSGFGSEEIAKALITNEAVIRKRLYRAKEFIKNNRIELEIPAGNELTRRLETVYTVLYLLFNEGYNSVKADELIRRDLCAEAMRLCFLLSQHKSGKQPSTFALLSLMCFHASRFESRIGDNNSIILLQDQDRSKWNHALIGKGYEYLTLSSQGDDISVYHIESAIAAEYSLAQNFSCTNWERLLELYDLLLQYKTTPVVILNRSIILSQLHRVKEAIDTIEAIDNIDTLIQTHYIYGAVLGDLYIKYQHPVKAKELLLQAHSLTTSLAEKKLIVDKIQFVEIMIHQSN